MRKLFVFLILALSFTSPARADEGGRRAFALSAMLRLSPPDRHRPPPGWEETPEAIAARYKAIAADVAAVARTNVEAAALVGVAWHESGFAADVDAGQCYQGKGYRGRCDSGRALGLWQLQATAGELRGNRRAQAREALRRIMHSRKACAENAAEERLAAYAGGTCAGDAAKVAARSLDASIRKALRLGVLPLP